MEESYARRLRAARNGNRTALGWLLSREQAWLSMHADRITSSGTNFWTAPDLVQECCLAVLRLGHPPTSRTRAQFRAWLKTIARNHVLNELRRCRPEFLEEDRGGEVAMSEKGPQANFLFELMSASRKNLRFRLEAILVLRDCCDCSFETIARLLGCPSKKAAYRLRAKALETLKEGCSQSTRGSR